MNMNILPINDITTVDSIASVSQSPLKHLNSNDSKTSEDKESEDENVSQHGNSVHEKGNKNTNT